MQVLHTIEDLEDVLLDRIDNNGNTIAHIAAEGGHVSIFKVDSYVCVCNSCHRQGYGILSSPCRLLHSGHNHVILYLICPG